MHICAHRDIKMKNLKSVSAAIAAAGFCLSVSAFAAPFSVQYDTDGKNRASQYAQGPVKQVITVSASALNYQAYIFSDVDVNECEYASAYDQASGNLIGSATVNHSEYKAYPQNFSMSFEPQYAQNDKLIKLACSDVDGSRVEVQHKVPGAPIIDWSSSLVGQGEWTPAGGCGHSHCGGGFGSFESVQYNATVKVNNQTSDAYCRQESHGLDVNLFHGKDYRVDFYSDQFWTSAIAAEYTAPTITQRVICENSGGITTYTQIWETASEDFNLVYEYSRTE